MCVHVYVCHMGVICVLGWYVCDVLVVVCVWCMWCVLRWCVWCVQCVQCVCVCILKINLRGRVPQKPPLLLFKTEFSHWPGACS